MALAAQRAGRASPVLKTFLVPVGLLGLGVLLSGCLGATGDFGRTETGPFTSQFLPSLGRANAIARDEPASYFNLTDNERLLRNRATHLTDPPHARDWSGRAVTALETTRVIPGYGRAHAPERYYGFLRSDRFRSSESRYMRLKSDIGADLELVPPFCAIAGIVRATDRDRISATRRRPDLTEVEFSNAHGRVYENNLVINQVDDALGYRLAAYRFAIDRMEMETPSEQIWEANRAWRYLSAAILACRQHVVGDRLHGAGDVSLRRSRIYTGPFEDDGPVPQK